MLPAERVSPRYQNGKRRDLLGVMGCLGNELLGRVNGRACDERGDVGLRGFCFHFGLQCAWPRDEIGELRVGDR